MLRRRTVLWWVSTFTWMTSSLAGCSGVVDGGGVADAVDAAPDARPLDPAIAFCPYIGEHDYTHPSDAFFEPSEVITIDVTMAPDDWAYQLANPDLEEYRPATVTFCGETVDGAGMRFKRSTHPNSDLEEGYAKNPIVLDLNEFAPGQRLRSLRKINLEYGSDQVLVGQRLNWELLANFGQDVARVNYARVHVNGEYIGVFINIERVDRSYANYHWGENDGQLYKHAYCGTFRYKGTSASDYTNDPRCYDPQPSDSVTDYSDLIDVIDVLNNTPTADLPTALPALWDIDAWIPTMAALQVIPYADSPNANGNNFYTYYPAGGGVTRFALWDMDAGYWKDGAPCESGVSTVQWDLFTIAKCFRADGLPLFHRVLDVPAWRQRYIEAAQAFVAGPFAPPTVAARVAVLVEQLRVPLAEDPNRRGTEAEWETSIETLLSRQAARAANVQGQLDSL